MNIWGLKKGIERAKKRIKIEKSRNRNEQNLILIKKLQSGIRINRDKIKELKKLKKKK